MRSYKQARQARREDQAGMWLPEPLLAEPGTDGPESRAVMAESIGLALLIVLESLAPPERLAFVLHDIFAVPFGNIGQITGRTPEAARQLASRARRRVQAAPQPDPDPPARRRAVDAFLSAAREGASPPAGGAGPRGGAPVRSRPGPGSAAGDHRRAGGRPAHLAHRAALAAGRDSGHRQRHARALYGTWDQPLCVLGFTVVQGQIAELHLVADRAKLHHLRLSFAPGRTQRPGDQQ
jgi:RNA polymerase sigma-70 factor (ECF subfamily)